MKKRVCKADQIRLIMECRQSGLSDYQWCEKNGIYPGTFYNWISKLRKSGYTDMRKSIDGLCAIILDQLKSEPDCHAIFLFCGKRCDRIKVLLREPDGYVLLYKRLDVVHGKYLWPRNSSEVKPITWQQFDWLMSGLETEQPKALQTA